MRRVPLVLFHDFLLKRFFLASQIVQLLAVDEQKEIK
jgi:hypothetical protein